MNNNPPVIDDRRTDEDRAHTAFLVVATDSFLSGWGQAPRRSYFAVPCPDADVAAVVLDNMHHRSEMKRPRLVIARTYRPHLRPGDHLSIRAMSEIATTWYSPGYFHAQALNHK